jgi:hypothetical protein
VRLKNEALRYSDVKRSKTNKGEVITSRKKKSQETVMFQESKEERI